MLLYIFSIGHAADFDKKPSGHFENVLDIIFTHKRIENNINKIFLMFPM
jgi:hypothetical protein